MGTLFMRAHWWGPALDQFGAVLDQHPEDLSALANAAWVLNKLRRFDEALAVYDRLLRAAPHYGSAYLGKADALRQLGRHELALDAYREGLELDSRNVIASFNMALTLVALGKLQDALVMYRRLARAHPEDAEVLANLGVTLGRLGHWQEALEFNRRAAELRPTELHTMNVATALSELGRHREAVSMFRRVLDINPNSVEATVRLGLALADGGDPQAGLSLLEPLVASDPDNSAATAALCGVRVLAGRCDDALSLALRLASESASSSIVWETLGWVALKCGKGSTAVLAYQRCVEMNPVPEMYAWLGAALVVEGRHEEALVHFERAIAEDPHVVERHDEIRAGLAAARANRSDV